MDPQFEQKLEELVGRATLMRELLDGLITEAEGLLYPRRPANEVRSGMAVRKGGTWLTVVSTSLVPPDETVGAWYVRLEFEGGTGQVYPHDELLVAREGES